MCYNIKKGDYMNIFEDYVGMFSNAFTNFETRTETSDLSTFEFILDLYDTYKIVLALPGFDKKNISVSLSENSLKVTAKDNSFKSFGLFKDDFEKDYNIPNGVSEPVVKFEHGALSIKFKKTATNKKLEIL